MRAMSTGWGCGLQIAQRIKDIVYQELVSSMGWWPFSSKISKDMGYNLHIKGTKVWLDDLRDICEINYDKPEAGRMRVREMAIEWADAYSKSELDDTLFEGLERRAFQLTRASDEELVKWLDDDGFWKPGWRLASDSD